MIADKDKVTHYINVARGQLDGVKKMIDSDAYCIDISNQIMASIAILKKANKEVLTAHLEHCVRNAKGDEIDAKIKEIESLLERL
jgi:DNA-binding FrmR family transcriptional regulator